MNRAVLIVQLDPTHCEKLRRPIVGSGGFQQFILRLQGQFLTAGVISLEARDVAKLYRYEQSYGGGGFQGRLGGLFDQVDYFMRHAKPE